MGSVLVKRNMFGKIDIQIIIDWNETQLWDNVKMKFGSRIKLTHLSYRIITKAHL